MRRLLVDNRQFLSASLGVQVLVVVSGLGPHVPDNDTRDDDVQGLVLGSSENIEHGVVQGTLQWLGSKWSDGVNVDVLLLGTSHGAPPADVCLSTCACHY